MIKLMMKTTNKGKLTPRLAKPPIFIPFNCALIFVYIPRRTKKVTSPAKENTDTTMATIMTAKLVGIPPLSIVLPPYLTTIARMMHTINT
jgi:hypothetical protein